MPLQQILQRSRRRSPTPQLLGLVSVVLAGAFAIYATSAPREPVAAAEGLFLAFLSCLVLLCFAPAAIAFHRQHGSTPSARAFQPMAYAALVLLVVGAVWGLPTGAVRGCTAGLLLALSPLFVWSAVPLPAKGGTTRRAAFDLAIWLPAAVGIQFLFRTSTLLPLELSPRRLVTWVVLPILGVLFAKALEKQFGAGAVTLALLAVVLTCGGFTVNGVLALGVLAIGVSSSRLWAGGVWSIGAGASGPGLANLEAQSEISGPWRRWSGLALLATLAFLFAWDPVRGAVILVGALYVIGLPTVASRKVAKPSSESEGATSELAETGIARSVLGRGWAAILFVAAGLLAAFTEPRGWTVVANELALLGFLFPAALALFVSQSGWKRTLGPGLAAALLAMVALRSLEPVDALAMPAAILALCWFGRVPRVAGDADPRPSSSAFLRPSLLWLLLLVVLTAAAAGYPWLRWPELKDTMDRLTGESLSGLVVLWLSAAGLIWLSGERARTAGDPPQRSLREGLASVVSAVLVLAATLVVVSPFRRSVVLIDWPPVQLDRVSPELSIDLPEPPWSGPSRLIIESTLIDSGAGRTGEPALGLRWLSGNGNEGQSILGLGVETGEWAATREGVAAPEPWISWVAPAPPRDQESDPPPSRQFFGQRYRSQVELGTLDAGSKLWIDRAVELPDKTRATIYRLILLPGRKP